MDDYLPTVKPERPVLQYHGAKWMLAPWIISYFPRHEKYLECFGGGGSILLNKPRSASEIYNDLWGEVVNVFRVLRDPTQTAILREHLRLTPFARAELDNSIIPCDEPIEQARRTLVRSWFEFYAAKFANGEGLSFATSYRNEKVHRLDEWLTWQECIPTFTERLRSVVIENWPAVDVIRKYDSKTTLHYVDPPYVHETRAAVDQATGYAKEMTDDDHVVLAHVLHEVEGMVILSGYPCKLYDQLYRHWEVIEKPTVIAHTGGERKEVLWINKRATEMRARQMSFFDTHTATAYAEEAPGMTVESEDILSKEIIIQEQAPSFDELRREMLESVAAEGIEIADPGDDAGRWEDGKWVYENDPLETIHVSGSGKLFSTKKESSMSEQDVNSLPRDEAIRYFMVNRDMWSDYHLKAGDANKAVCGEDMTDGNDWHIEDRKFSELRFDRCKACVKWKPKIVIEKNVPIPEDKPKEQPWPIAPSLFDI